MNYTTDTTQEIQNEPLPPKKRFSFLKRLVVAAIVVMALGYVFVHATGAPKDFPTTGDTFTIHPGDNLKSIGLRLQSDHYIRSQFIFSLLISIGGAEHHISPGDYYFAHPMSVSAIALQIATGNHNLTPIKVTIPEGVTVKEMKSILSPKLPALDMIAFEKLSAPQEGYLFPETYFFYPKTTSEQVVTQMRTMFDQKTNELFARNNVTEESKKNIVILASLIEREAHGDDDRATIAGILTRRLQTGMALQVDATVAYANGKPENALVKADFSKDSPYNTYIYKGLPPGPISNPGLEALTAAVNPAPTPYLYYLHDKHGTIHYAKTYKEHLANIDHFLR